LALSQATDTSQAVASGVIVGAPSLPECAITVSFASSSSVIAGSTARRRPAILSFLVRSITNEESTNKSPVA
jgi:hypothetical protein